MNGSIINGSDFLFFPFSLQVAEPEDYTVDYGERAEHCWNGAHNLSNAVSVQKRISFEPFYTKNDHFTKTRSGQA